MEQIFSKTKLNAKFLVWGFGPRKKQKTSYFPKLFFFLFQHFWNIRKEAERRSRSWEETIANGFVCPQKKEKILQWPVSFKDALRQGCPTQISWRAKKKFHHTHLKGAFIKKRSLKHKILGLAGQIKSFRGPHLARGRMLCMFALRHRCPTFSQFHQHSRSTFWANFLSPKDYKP